MLARRYCGIAMRNIAASHLKAIGFVMFVLLTIAIAIDLTKTLDDIRAKAISTDRNLFSLVGEYLLYRSADIVARMLPMACLAGSFIAELLRHQRMENVILAAAGAPPALAFVAFLSAGAILGVGQAALEGWLRPAAVFAQVDLGLGSYASRFREGNLGSRWIVEGDLAIRTQVIRGDDPQLRKLQIFKGVGADELETILTAETALPTAKPGVWTLLDVVEWTGTTGGALQPVQKETATIVLPLSAAHLRYFDIYGFYLPNDALWDVAAIKGTARTADAETAIVRRITALILPGIFLFLGASLAQAGRNGRFFAWWRLLALGTLGYVTVVSVKTFWSLGEFGVLPPLAATLLPLGLAFVVATGIQCHLNGVWLRKQP